MLKLTPQDEGTFNRLLHVTVADSPETPSGETPEYIFEEAELISRGLKSYVDRNVAAYVASLASTLDNFIWRTYAIAVNHAAGARVRPRLPARQDAPNTARLTTCRPHRSGR